MNERQLSAVNRMRSRMWRAWESITAFRACIERGHPHWAEHWAWNTINEALAAQAAFFVSRRIAPRGETRSAEYRYVDDLIEQMYAWLERE